MDKFIGLLKLLPSFKLRFRVKSKRVEVEGEIGINAAAGSNK